MIATFQLKFGRAPGIQAARIDATPVTVFVGPNNSGKSRVLAEIDRFCRRGTIDLSDLILKDLTFAGLKGSEAENLVELVRMPSKPEDAQYPDRIHIGSVHGNSRVVLVDLLRWIEDPETNPSTLCRIFLTHFILRLDGQSRIGLVHEQGAGDLQGHPQSSFQTLFQNASKRREVRRIVLEAFGVYFVIDPTNLGKLRIRLAERAPKDVMEECGIHPEAVQYHANAQLIDQTSDGVKAFTGIISQIIAGDPRVVLIDEPEAFLHPSLAFKLGLEISHAALPNGKRVFASTHSPQFVMGCIQSGRPVTIVRLTYRGGVATARVLPGDELLELMRHPLLRSTGVLQGLFHEFVVVTESDTDRVFYQEINERLLKFKPEWGIPNCLFINAQNKQTIHTIIRPLRHLGIPAAAIVDVDVLKEGGTNWTNLLSGASVPDISHGSLGSIRAAIKIAMDATHKDMKRDGGLAILQQSDREATENLFSQLAEYGIFVVPGGELESWVRHLGVGGKGTSWLIEVFERMGEDSAHPDYVRPTDGDVWEFLFRIRGWLTDAGRKGIPI